MSFGVFSAILAFASFSAGIIWQRNYGRNPVFRGTDHKAKGSPEEFLFIKTSPDEAQIMIMHGGSKRIIFMRREGIGQ